MLFQADHLIINAEVLCRLQESFAVEIMSLSLFVSHGLLEEENNDNNNSNSSSNSNDNNNNTSGVSDLQHQHQQQQAKEKIRLDEEAPTFWLLRYGDKLTKITTTTTGTETS